MTNALFSNFQIYHSFVNSSIGLTSGDAMLIWGGAMGRVRVKLTLDACVAETARTLGLNMSPLAEAAIREAARLERNRLWRADNQAAINAYAEEVAKEGLPLAGLRSF